MQVHLIQANVLSAPVLVFQSVVAVVGRLVFVEIIRIVERFGLFHLLQSQLSVQVAVVASLGPPVAVFFALEEE